MHLIQILLPLYDKDGHVFPAINYSGVKKKLTEKFGGLTIYTRGTATGLWKEKKDKTVQDEIIVYEVMADELDQNYWSSYKAMLQWAFHQEEIVVRASEITML